MYFSVQPLRLIHHPSSFNQFDLLSIDNIQSCKKVALVFIFLLLCLEPNNNIKCLFTFGLAVVSSILQ
ncbi:hypothetical protein AOLI_G00016160 [Acnodon oligacanthus]